jgi:hypothetical protein
LTDEEKNYSGKHSFLFTYLLFTGSFLLLLRIVRNFIYHWIKFSNQSESMIFRLEEKQSKISIGKLYK